MQLTMLKYRREELAMPIRSLARMSGVPVATVNRILSDPAPVRFAHVAAVARVLGVDFVKETKIPVKRMLKKRATAKAQYVAKAVQGNQGLEAAGLDPAGYQRIVAVAVERLLAGRKQKKRLWDED